MSRRYTAQEMRDYADAIAGDLEGNGHIGVEYCYYDLIPVIEALRQAADEKMRLDSILDAIEKEFKKQSTCRSCEWRGKSIRSEPACPCDKDENFSVYEIDIIDRLLQAADMMERKKKYEYGVRWCDDEAVMTHSKHTAESIVMDVGKELVKVVRREVGAWEDVPNEAS